MGNDEASVKADDTLAPHSNSPLWPPERVVEGPVDRARLRDLLPADLTLCSDLIDREQVAKPPRGVFFSVILLAKYSLWYVREAFSSVGRAFFGERRVSWD